MAESTLSLEYSDFQREVAYLLGWSRTPSSWDNTQEQDFSDIQRRALRMFYFPPQTGWPLYFAVRNKAHAPTTGQRWEFLTYPTPATAQAAAVITYRYVTVPNTLDSTNKYPLGGAQYSEVILAAYLACAEYKMDDDPNGPFAQKFQEMLQVAMRNDEQQKANSRGGSA